MKAQQLEKVYNPAEFEGRIYSFWMDNSLFSPAEENGKEPFVIVIPPPNVTGVLHMGHGLNNSLQDILVRYYRMVGRPVLWVPGTDHAGIATQNVVEKKLRSRGLSRRKIGREEFVKETWKVKEEHHSVIIEQLKKIGASCDWNRERFTLDEGLSKAVREVFVVLYEKGLIYKGNYLVNWCSSCGTALSDDEVEYRELNGRLYHYYYPLEDGSGKIEIATTRPETMLGDTAVAVNPEDGRYKDLIGKKILLPLTDRKIPVIADDYVDMEFGSGAVKITPAHDPNDREIGKRHGLEEINILNDDGTLNSCVPEKYRGMNTSDARKAVILDLKAEGLYKNEKEHLHQVGHCYRCGTLIEPYLSEQWFVKMKPMAEKAMKAWEDKKIRFYPKKWENTYTHWLKGIRDWCISRQLWWGHRIPVWYCRDCGETMVLREAPDSCSGCGSSIIRQDDDVLDTWFSSWLWPFSTLGWPEKTEDLKRFYPTTSLVTAYDIIFFWVARMIMAGLEFLGEVPFSDIYITGLVRDIKGRKMSKSLGNGMDPLEIVNEYGADALKFTLSFMAATGQDLLIEKDSFKLGSKFANKIWTASRFLLMYLEGRRILDLDSIELKDVDRWIFHRLNECVKTVKKALSGYKFSEASQGVYEFFWNDFCDWYLEASKISLYSKDDREKDKAISLLIILLEESLRLLHPFLSFITEEIYGKLPVKKSNSIIVSKYPDVRKDREAFDTAEHFELLKELVRLVRTLRSEFRIPPGKKIKVLIDVDKGFVSRDFFLNNLSLISSLTGAAEMELVEKGFNKEGSVSVIGNGFTAYVFVRDVIDVPEEKEKLLKELNKLELQLSKTENKLKNEKFLKRAPENIIEKEKQILMELTGRRTKIKSYLKTL